MTIMPDVRVEYLEAVSFIILKYKADKWGKLIGAEENMALLTEFFDKTDVSVLVLTLNAAGMIVPCLGFPESLKSKGIYFIKTKPENITKDNYKTSLLYGDISPTPVDQLIAVVEEVRVPRLAGWGWSTEALGGPGVRGPSPHCSCSVQAQWPHLRAGWKCRQTCSKRCGRSPS